MNPRILQYLILVLILLICGIAPISAQVTSSFWVRVHDNVAPWDTTTMIFGNHSNATYCVDSLSPIIIERRGPPISPGYDTRWMQIPGRVNCFGYGLIIYNFIPFPNNSGKRDTFALYFSNLGYPDSAFYFSWPESSYLASRCDSMLLVESTGKIPPINMFKQQSFKVVSPGTEDPQINRFFIYKFGVRGVDTVLPVYNNSISGNAFNDLNGNGIRNIGDSTMSGWNILLRNSSYAIIDSRTTDSAGHYVFKNIPPGTCYISEVKQFGWVQTYPTGFGFHKVAVSSDSNISGKNFGNTYGYRYIGGSTGNWADSTNWTGKKPPGPDDAVIIPPYYYIIVDSLPRDTIKALQIDAGGVLEFTPEVGKLLILQSLHMDSGSTLRFSALSDTTGLVCYKDFINRGTLEPGHSVITYEGDVPKIIAGIGAGNNFYKLEINGDSTYSIGNISVEDRLTVKNILTPQGSDTVFIQSEDTAAIQGSGIIYQGTIIRFIKSDGECSYRFESPDTYVRFSGDGINPSKLIMSVWPDDLPKEFYWDSVGGRLDTLKNTIIADSVNKFSKWVFGTPRPKISSLPVNLPIYKINPISRIYNIKPIGGLNYRGEISLRYDQSKLSGSMEGSGQNTSSEIPESDLMLFRGPYAADSVGPLWNLVSLPLFPDSGNKSELFPTAISSAFAYAGTYEERQYLNFGEGYWVKFPGAGPVLIEGDDLDSIAVDVREGWNLIGALSYKINPASVTSIPGGIISSEIFEYKTSYQPADSMRPFFGYWVKTSAAGKLILKVPGDESIAKNSFHGLEGMSSLNISDANNHKADLYFGFGKNIDPDRYELPPPPPEGMFDVRYNTGSMLAIAEGENVFPVQISGAVYPLIISLGEINQSIRPELLIDGKTIALEKDAKITINDDSKRIKLRFSSGIAAEVPLKFELYQNYPNPFNPVTTIRYQLPYDSKITLNVYNTLGQVVAVLGDEIQQSGYKSIEWNANSVASGVYFYRLEATSITDPGKTFTQVKKMVFVK